MWVKIFIKMQQSSLIIYNPNPLTWEWTSVEITVLPPSLPSLICSSAITFFIVPWSKNKLLADWTFEFKYCIFWIFPPFTYIVAKIVFTIISQFRHAREALGCKCSLGLRPNCASSKRALQPGATLAQLVVLTMAGVLPTSCLNVSAPSAWWTGRSRAPPAGPKLFYGHLSPAQLPVRSPTLGKKNKVGLFVSTRCPSRDRQLFRSANPPTSRGDELGSGAPTAFPQRTRAFQITPASNLLIHL